MSAIIGYFRAQIAEIERDDALRWYGVAMAFLHVVTYLFWVDQRIAAFGPGPLPPDLAVLRRGRRRRLRLRDRPRARRGLGAPGEARLDLLGGVRPVLPLSRAVVAGRRLLLSAAHVRDPDDLSAEPARRAAGAARPPAGLALEGPGASIPVRDRRAVLAAPAGPVRLSGRPHADGRGPPLRAPYVRRAADV